MRNFFRDEMGGTLIEYGVLAALIGLGTIVVIETTGKSMRLLLETVAGRFEAAAQETR